MYEEKVIRDLVYFDISKTTSLLSQFSDGLPTEIVENESQVDQTKSSGTGNLHFVKGELASQQETRKGKSETKTLHHDLLDRVENHLFDNGFCIDINQATEN